MKILAIGDVVGKSGTEFLISNLENFKKEKSIDLIIANGENSAEGNGITPASARLLFSAGADVITTGNHAFRRREIFPFLNENQSIIRPFNFPQKTTPGRGICKIKVNNTKVCVINLMGIEYLASLRCPFECMDNILKECADCPIKIVDFHAEATSEKRALGFYLDGKISALFGTHTHVQTSDEEILSRGTGYITDVGMTGTADSVLGVKKELSIKRFKEKIPLRFENAYGRSKMECIIFEIDEHSGKTIALDRIRIVS